MIQFEAFPKVPRLRRQMVVTEKIDGTNAAVVVQGVEFDYEPEPYEQVVANMDGVFAVAAQSRKRFVFPGQDNAGFGAWVHANAATLAAYLGEGRHFGEWWGKGIQRGYGLNERRFSLFNTSRWDSSRLVDDLLSIGVRTVPVLYTGMFDTDVIDEAIYELKEHGSFAAPDFMKPEGVMVYHTAAGQMFKRLIENDDISKTEAESA